MECAHDVLGAVVTLAIAAFALAAGGLTSAAAKVGQQSRKSAMIFGSVISFFIAIVFIWFWAAAVA